MITGTIIAIVIIAIAVAVRAGLRPKKPNLQWSNVGSFLGGIVVLVVVCWVGYKGYKWWTKPPAPSRPATTQEASRTTTQEQEVATKALVLRFDGFTPCDPRFDYTFELDTQGDSISLKFPNVREPVQYSGKGTIEVPKHRTSGPVHIISTDSNKQARVRIWEVVYIRK